MNDAGRLDDLEIALAHAEQAISDLSDVAAAQARDIEALRTENRRLIYRLARVEAMLAEGKDADGDAPDVWS